MTGSRIVLRVAATIVIVVALAFVAVRPHGGMSSLSFDSFRYLAGAWSIRDAGAYRDLDGKPQQVWPPGTSLLYATLSRVSGVAPERLVHPIDLASVAIALIAFWLLLEASGAGGVAAGIAFAAFGWNGFFLSEANKLWSDPIALALLLGMLACLAHGLRATTLGRATMLLLAADALLALAIVTRYAMIAAVAVAIVAALIVCLRERRRWWLVVVPLLTPLVTIAAFALLHATRGNRSFALHPLQLRANAVAFAELAGQLLPSFGIASVLVVIAVTIVAPLVVARRDAAVMVVLTWIAAYALFLVVSQALTMPSFTTDLRILFPLYPALLLAAAVAAETLWRHRSSFVAVSIVLVLAVGALRAARFIAGSLRAAPRPDCREAIAAQLNGIEGPSAISNAQGVVWYALRRPTVLLTRASLANAAHGSTVVWVDGSCPNSVDTDEVTREEASAGIAPLRIGDGIVVGRTK